MFTNITVYATISGSGIYRQEKRTEVVAEGVIYEKTSLLTSNGWVDIHVIKVDLNNPYVSLDILRALDDYGTKDQLTDLVQNGENVVAGINGSFFNTNYAKTDIVGDEYEDDTYVSVQHNYNVGASGAASIIDNGSQMYIDFFGASIVLNAGSNFRLYVSGINRVTNITSYPIIFNSKAGTNTSEIPAILDTYKIVVTNDIVTAQVLPGQNVAIPEDGYIIVLPDSLVHNTGNADYLTPLKVGTVLDLSIDTTITEENLKMVFTGGGKILENGLLVAPTSMVVEPNKRHPRSALGLTEDGQYLIAMVVDGRGSSIGATHAELANYLQSYNVSDAMHLDGGGSSTIVGSEPGYGSVDVLNTPSDGAERRVVNGLGFVSNAPLTDDITIELIPEKNAVYLGGSIQFEVIGYDSNYNTIDINSNDIYFVSQGIAGTWNGLKFTPSTTGSGKVTCYYGAKSSSVNISSYNTFYDIDVTPSVLSLNKNETGSFSVTGTSIGGFIDQVPAGLIKYSVTDTSIGSFINGKFVPTGKSGYTKVVVTAGSRSVTTYVTVGVEELTVSGFETASSFSPVVLMDRFQEDINPITSDDILAINANNHVSLSQTRYYAGQSSLALTYSIDPMDIYQNEAIVGIEGVVINAPISQIDLYTVGVSDQFDISLSITDDNGDLYKVPLTSKDPSSLTTWRNYAGDIGTMAYPITVDSVKFNYDGAGLATGTIYIDNLATTGFYGSEGFMFDYEPFINDPILKKPSSYSSQISIFGSTAGRNRLLDSVVLSKVYEEVSDADIVFFAGLTNVDKQKVDATVNIWNDKYKIIDYPDVRVIQLATSKGGLFLTDPTQWAVFEAALAATSQNNIIIIGDRDPRSTFEDEREGQLLQDVLESYALKTGTKQIFYITANGYDFDVSYENGIRYITMNGLWYRINGNEINLNDTFYVLDFYISNHQLTYDIRNLYPKIEVE